MYSGQGRGAQEEIPNHAGFKDIEDLLGISKGVNKKGELKIVKKNIRA